MKSHYLFLISILPLGILFAQSGQRGSIILPGQLSQVFLAASSDSVLQLPDQYIVSGSEHIVVDSLRSIPQTGYYSLDERSGKIVLLPAWHRLLNDTFFAISFATGHDLLSQNWQRSQFSFVGQPPRTLGVWRSPPLCSAAGEGFRLPAPALPAMLHFARIPKSCSFPIENIAEPLDVFRFQFLPPLRIRVARLRLQYPHIKLRHSGFSDAASNAVMIASRVSAGSMILSIHSRAAP